MEDVNLRRLLAVLFLAGTCAVAASAQEGSAPSTVSAPPTSMSAGVGEFAQACPEDAPVPAAFAVQDDSLQGKVKGALDSGSLPLALLLVLFGGFLTALSPCVYPLIPITLSIFGARQATTKLSGFLLSATYVSGMVILYSVLGVGFAAMGKLGGSALQSPWITIGVALFCVVMAASMFGAFEFALPSGLQTRLAQMGGRGFKGAFVMGLVAGIIAAPCTGPVLSFILTLIARDGDLVKGAVLMVSYALGMGLPFLVLGTFSQAISRVPKSGAWMEVVKSIFGLLMLGAAIYYLQFGVRAVGEAFHPIAASGAWLGPLLLVTGVLAGALHLSFKDSSVLHKVRKGTGLALCTVGLASFLAWVNADSTTTTSAPPIAWQDVGAQPDAVTKLDALLADAKRACRPVMIDFFAEWCVACKELDKLTYSQQVVRADATRFTTIKVDATEDTDALAAIQKRFGIVGLPTIVFVTRNGKVLDDPKVTGFLDAPAYLEQMQRVR